MSKLDREFVDHGRAYFSDHQSSVPFLLESARRLDKVHTGHRRVEFLAHTPNAAGDTLLDNYSPFVVHNRQGF